MTAQTNTTQDRPKGIGRGWHGSSKDHAAAGKKGGLSRSARWKAAHQKSDSDKDTESAPVMRSWAQ